MPCSLLAPILPVAPLEKDVAHQRLARQVMLVNSKPLFAALMDTSDKMVQSFHLQCARNGLLLSRVTIRSDHVVWQGVSSLSACLLPFIVLFVHLGVDLLGPVALLLVGTQFTIHPGKIVHATETLVAWHRAQAVIPLALRDADVGRLSRLDIFN